MKHGEGKFTWESGNWFEGVYQNDKRHGFGRMHWADGTVYEGDWEHGAQHGRGTLKLPNGDCKEGIFENNVYIKDKSVASSRKKKELHDREREDSPEKF
jgi:hypothetical protein